MVSQLTKGTQQGPSALEVASPTAKPRNLPRRGSARARPPLSILLVDDDPGILVTLGNILTEAGFQLQTAHDGTEALDDMRKRPFDVVLTDLKMPGMNGVDLMREVQRASPHTMVLMMTAFTKEELAYEAQRRGAITVLPRPLDPDKAAALIKTFCGPRPLLVLDGERDYCVAVESRLKEKGHRTIHASGPQEALDLMSGRSRYIVFLTIDTALIPGRQGLLVVKEVDPGVAMILGADDQSSAEEFPEEQRMKGSFVCLYKPLDIDRLLRLLKRFESEKDSN